MRKTLCIFISIILLFNFVPTVYAENNAELPNVSAEAYVLYCADNKEIICSQNESKKMKPASTTKLLTTLITLEKSAENNKNVEFTEEMTAEGSSMYLKIGEVVTLNDLAVGMMMSSGNDAANAAAISISGSFENFSELMNEKASQIGMTDSHFVTPSGLDDDNHYSTAYDLAKLMAYALENENFASLTSQKSTTVKFTQPSGKQTVYSNHNRLLSLYEYCIGGKTGYTLSAGRCLVSAAKKDGITLICVTLNDKNDWNDHSSLYDYGFSQLLCYSSADTEFIADIPCVGGNSDIVTVSGKKDVKIVLSRTDASNIKRTIYCDAFLYAPVCDNQPVGKIKYTLNNAIIAENDLIALTSADLNIKNNVLFKIKELITYG